MSDDATDIQIEAFARRVFHLVASVGVVSAWTPQIEFDWVIQAQPSHAKQALAFTVRLNERDVVVESTQLGWWTFDWDSDAHAAWRVIEQLVLRGGVVYRRFGWTGASELRDLEDHPVSGPHSNGGQWLRARRAVYPPYS